MSQESPQLQDRLAFAVEIARRAGEETLRFFRTSGLDVQRKQDGSPVTAADRQAEQLLRQQIRSKYPNDAILGEEFGETAGTSPFRWILDPIDGTKSFVSGVPLYTTLVAVLWQDKPQIGVIFAPAASEMVYAAKGSGSWHVVGEGTPQRAKVSTTSKLAEAVFLTTSVRSFSTDRQLDARPVYDQLQQSCRLTRTWGDAFGYLLVATGRAEIMIDAALSLWDAAALQPVIEEAGGEFFDWHGQPSVYSQEAIATNAALADRVMALAKPYSGR
ncbi:MAG: histidinol-phosphatase [Pirellulales bacterium]|nr:histidinol-phosphatase [Pirellulales bacterium]